MVDQALKLYPTDPELINMKKSLTTALATPQAQPTTQTPVQTQISVITPNPAATAASQSAQFYLDGVTAYNKKQYVNAAKSFLKSYELKKDLGTLDNVAMSYYAGGDFKTAKKYFEQLLAAGQSNSGKTEFYLGACIMMLGDRETACQYYNISADKGFEMDKQIIVNTCPK